MQPHRLQRTRPLHPWNSAGKNTGVGCHFLPKGAKEIQKVESLSHVKFSATPWTVAHQASPSWELSRQEDWSGLPCASAQENSGQRKPRFWRRLLLPTRNRLAGVGRGLGPLGLFPQCPRGQKEDGCLCGCWESASFAHGVNLPLNELVPIWA